MATAKAEAIVTGQQYAVRVDRLHSIPFVDIDAAAVPSAKHRNRRGKVSGVVRPIKSNAAVMLVVLPGEDGAIVIAGQRAREVGDLSLPGYVARVVEPQKPCILALTRGSAAQNASSAIVRSGVGRVSHDHQDAAGVVGVHVLQVHGWELEWSADQLVIAGKLRDVPVLVGS